MNKLCRMWKHCLRNVLSEVNLQLFLYTHTPYCDKLIKTYCHFGDTRWRYIDPLPGWILCVGIVSQTKFLSKVNVQLFPIHLTATNSPCQWHKVEVHRAPFTLNKLCQTELNLQWGIRGKSAMNSYTPYCDKFIKRHHRVGDTRWGCIRLHPCWIHFVSHM